jgi:hypothetical protein
MVEVEEADAVGIGVAEEEGEAISPAARKPLKLAMLSLRRGAHGRGAALES